MYITVNIVQCIQYSVYSIVHIVQDTMQCIQYRIHSSVYSKRYITVNKVQYLQYSVHIAVHIQYSVQQSINLESIQYNVYSIVHIVQCIILFMQCSLQYSVYMTVFSIQCMYNTGNSTVVSELYSEQYSIYSTGNSVLIQNGRSVTNEGLSIFPIKKKSKINERRKNWSLKNLNPHK